MTRLVMFETAGGKGLQLINPEQVAGVTFDHERNEISIVMVGGGSFQVSGRLTLEQVRDRLLGASSPSMKAEG